MKMKQQRRKAGVLDVDQDEPDLDLSDADEGFTENDKLLLERHRKNMQRKESDSDEEMYGIESSDEDQNDMNDDIENEDDDLPDVRAWGRRKRNYYDADYVDQDFGGIGAQEEEVVEMEEREATLIQNRLAEQLKESDFSLDVFTTSKKAPEVSKTEEKKIKEQIKRDLTQLSKRQKLELLEKESPELLSLVDLFKGYITKLSNFLQPMRNLIDDGSIPQCPASQCIKIYHELVLNYCMNLGFYLLLKARHVPVQAHPVVGRLVQYRQLINELEQCLPTEMHQQVDMILTTVSQTPTEKPKKQLLQLLRTAEIPTMDSSEDEAPPEFNQETADSDVSHEEEHDEAENEEEDSLGKRAITYQIAKNKGLTPYRKKELRNPRVKHRMKFRKAKIRRKGQVREARTELQKYGGELSGIKATVSKSVKLK